MLKRFLCFLLQHQLKLKNLRRVSVDLVECKCARCGKILTAVCGLNLEGKWEWGRDDQ